MFLSKSWSTFIWRDIQRVSIWHFRHFNDIYDEQVSNDENEEDEEKKYYLDDVDIDEADAYADEIDGLNIQENEDDIDENTSIHIKSQHRTNSCWIHNKNKKTWKNF